MNTWLNMMMVLIMVTNLLLLGTSGLIPCIRAAALQGVAVGLIAVLANAGHITYHVVLLAAVGITLKGFVFPRFLFWALRESSSRREVKPAIGYGASTIFGILALVGSFWLSSRLPHLAVMTSFLIIPVAFATILAGLFLIIARNKALNQVLGYLILENGIFIFGVALVKETPLLVEMGVMLDVFVAVFVMGIVMFHINREFDDIDTDQLSQLKD